MLKDGLYQVTHGTICAGFYIEKGRVLFMAPILRKWPMSWLEKKAVRVSD